MIGLGVFELFNYTNTPKNKVKSVTFKLKSSASAWLEQVQVSKSAGKRSTRDQQRMLNVMKA